MMQDNSDDVVVHTDGSCARQGENKTGGWAFRVEWDGKTEERWGFDPSTTNQEMELLAIRKALEFLNRSPQPLVIYTDSEYARKAITEWPETWEQNGWMTSTGTPVKNLELIQDILELMKVHLQVRKVDIRYVKGHNGDVYNERVDQLASWARKNQETWMPPRKVVRWRKRLR